MNESSPGRFVYKGIKLSTCKTHKFKTMFKKTLIYKKQKKSVSFCTVQSVFLHGTYQNLSTGKFILYIFRGTVLYSPRIKTTLSTDWS